MKAAGQGNLDAVCYLIEAGANVNAVDLNRNTALIYATMKDDNLDVIRLLVMSGARMDSTMFDSPLLYTSELEVIQFLVKCGADVNGADLSRKTALMRAARNGNFEVVQFFVNAGADVNSAGISQRTSLTYAVENDHLDIAQFLLENGADIDVVGYKGRTALMTVIRKAKLGAVQFLVENNANVNASDNSQRTVLMHAVWVGSLEIVKVLVNYGASIHATDLRGSTALLQATRMANLRVIRFLIMCGADINTMDSFGETSLMIASKMCDLELVRLLIEKGADVNATDCKNRSSIMFAIRNGDLDIVRFLVDSGADATELKHSEIDTLVRVADRYLFHIRAIRVLGTTLLNDLLISAVKCGEMDLVQFLIDAGANINTVDRRHCTPLLHASMREHWDAARILVNNGANVNAVDKYDGLTALLYAAQSDRLDIIQFLVEAGANVNATTSNGSPLLLYTTRMNGVDVVQFLVAAGADVNAGDGNNRTPLIEAVDSGKLSVVRFLVNNGADVNNMESDGHTALIHAAEKGFLDIIVLLVDSGAQINTVDKYGWTPLMYATQSGNLDVVDFLLANGADVSIVNKAGRTYFIANTHGYKDIQHLLTQHIPYIHQKAGMTTTQLPTNCFVSPFDVKLLEFIGSENVGGNYRALWLDAEVVVKLFVPEASATTFAHEVAVWRQLRHPNVIKLYGACDIGHHFFVCEWASNGSLIEHLAAIEKRGEPRKTWHFLHQAALGLAYLHERKIVHGNLCNNSILVGGDGLVKLADFQVNGSTITRPTGEQSDVEWGSFCWQAPERITGEAPSFASDIYSFCLCVMAAVTGETPWGGCLEYHCKSKKLAWNAISDRGVYFAPVNDMTTDLKLLASKMCSNDPRSRISASGVVRMLECLVTQEQTQSKLEQIELFRVSEYKDGNLLSKWRKLQDVASTVAADHSQLAIVCELETLYKHIYEDKQSVILLERLYKLINDCIGAIGIGSRQHRIIRLSSTRSQRRSMTAFYHRIDAIWNIIGDSHATGERKRHRVEYRLKHQEAFVSEVSQTLIIVNELETDEARNEFVAFLKTEIDYHGSSYTETQLNLLEKAYIDLKTCLDPGSVTTTPEWFLPWYELEIDGANYVAEGSFGEVYRAKWLETEIIVKKVKWASSNNSESWTTHSLSASSTQQTSNINYKDIRKMFEHEVSVWFGLSHPHVVRLFGACHVGVPLFACEYASNGSLDQYLRKHPTEIWEKLYEAALGVQYLHSRGIVHCDLKCNNIVVGRDKKAKVTDFGLSSANFVTGAWHWVAPECLESGPSELSVASDIYALGMCIVEALRIVENVTMNKKGATSLPWEKVNNNVVKYNVTKLKQLPGRPEWCTDDEWRLVKRMCAYDRSDRIKISTAVGELAVLAGTKSTKVTETESVKQSKELSNKIQQYFSLELYDEREVYSSNQIALRSVYGLLWNRFKHLCDMPNIESGCFERLIDRAHTSTLKLDRCPNTLTNFTEMAMNGYALHRELDKMIESNLWHVVGARGALHDWKTKCYTVLCMPEETTKQEAET